MYRVTRDWQPTIGAHVAEYWGGKTEPVPPHGVKELCLPVFLTIVVRRSRSSSSAVHIPGSLPREQVAPLKSAISFVRHPLRGLLSGLQLRKAQGASHTAEKSIVPFE